MIDTCRLILDDYSISTDSHLLIEPSAYCANSSRRFADHPLWINDTGEVIQGKKAYYNRNNLHISVAPLPQRNPVSEQGRRFSNVFCSVTLSLPRYAKRCNLAPLDLKASKGVFRQLEQDLQQIGIKTNIQNSRLSRLDTFKNLATDEPFIAYHPLFELLQAKRMKKQEFGGTTFLWANKQHEISAYDKKAEMAARGIKTSHLPKNLLRFEYRLLKPLKVQKVLGIKTVTDLCQNYHLLIDTYNRSLKEHLFRYEAGKIEEFAYQPNSTAQTSRNAIQKFQNEIEAYSSTQGRNGLQRYFSALGMNEVLQHLSTEEFARIIALATGKKNPCVRRVLCQAQQARFELSALRSTSAAVSAQKSFGLLYQELETKLLED